MTGFWVVLVNRTNGSVASEYITDKGEAYQRALDLQREDDNIATFVARAK